jgi:hypothetical protein
MGIRRITTRDIAKHLDLHDTTVAEALRNSRAGGAFLGLDLVVEKKQSSLWYF